MGNKLVEQIKEEGFDIVRSKSINDLLEDYRDMNPYDQREFMVGIEDLIDRLVIEKEGVSRDKLFLRDNSKFFTKSSFWQTHDKYVASEMITQDDLNKFRELLSEIQKQNARKR